MLGQRSKAVLQVYQAKLLKDADQSEGVSPNIVVELHRTTDLNLHSTKQVARAIDIVATERHVWLNLLGLKEQERYFLLDAALSPSGLFGKSSKSSGRRNVMWQWHLKSTSPVAVRVLQSPLLICSQAQLAAGSEGECFTSKESALEAATSGCRKKDLREVITAKK